MRMTWLATVGIALVAGCSNHVSGDLTVNGDKLELSSCRNGVVYGYRGVEVTAKSGMRLRIAYTRTGEADVVVMPDGAATGTDLGKCGSLTVDDQNSTINSVKNVEGKADLDCSGGGFAVKGTVQFENCH